MDLLQHQEPARKGSQEKMSAGHARVHPAAKRSISEPVMSIRPGGERTPGRFPLMGQTSLQENTSSTPRSPAPDLQGKPPPRFPLMGQLSLQEISARFPPKTSQSPPVLEKIDFAQEEMASSSDQQELTGNSSDNAASDSTSTTSVPSLLEHCASTSSPVTQLSEQLDWDALVSLGDAVSAASDTTSSVGSSVSERHNLDRWREKLRQRGLERWKEKLRLKKALDEERESWSRLEKLVQRLSPVQQCFLSNEEGMANVINNATLDQNQQDLINGNEYGQAQFEDELLEQSDYENSDEQNQNDVKVIVENSDITADTINENDATISNCEVENHDKVVKEHKHKPSLDELMQEENELMSSLLCAPGQTLDELEWRSPSLKPLHVSLPLPLDHSSMEPAVLYESPLYQPPRDVEAPLISAAAGDASAGSAKRPKARRKRRRRLMRSESAPVSTAVASNGRDVVDVDGVCQCSGCGDVSPPVKSGGVSLQLKCEDDGAPRLKLASLADERLQRPYAYSVLQKRGQSQPNLLHRAQDSIKCKKLMCSNDSTISDWAQRHLDMIEEAHTDNAHSSKDGCKKATTSRPVVLRRRDPAARQQRMRARRSYPCADMDSDEELLPLEQLSRRSVVQRSASVDSGTGTSPCSMPRSDAESSAVTPAPPLQSPRSIHSQTAFRSLSVDSGRPNGAHSAISSQAAAVLPPGAVVLRRTAPRRRMLRPRSAELQSVREWALPRASWSRDGLVAPLSADGDGWPPVAAGRGRFSAYFIRDTGLVLSGGGADDGRVKSAQSGSRTQHLALSASKSAASMNGIPNSTESNNEDVGSDTAGRTASSSSTSTLSSSNMKSEELTDFLRRVESSIPPQTGASDPSCASDATSASHSERSRTIATQTSPTGSAASSWSDVSDRAPVHQPATSTTDACGAVTPSKREATTSTSRRPALRTLRARSEEPGDPARSAAAVAFQWQSAEQMHRLPEHGEPAPLAPPHRRPIRPLQLQLGDTEQRRRLPGRVSSPAASPLSTPGDERPLPLVTGAAEEKPPAHSATGPQRPQQRRRSSHLYLEMAARMSCSEPTLDHAAARTQLARTADFQRAPSAMRSFSAKQLAEWEALEACRWLRDAGFPQYALMYEECRCAIDLRAVQSDHPLLDRDSRHALFRRINTVNRAINMKLEAIRRPGEESEDEETSRAISDNWSYLRHSQRWRRHQGVALTTTATSPPSGSSNSTLNSDSSAGAAVVHDRKDPIRRSGRERLQDGASAILRRVESIRARRKRQQKTANGAPQSPPGGARDDSSSYFSASDASVSPRAARPGAARDDSGALSDGEHSPPLWRPVPGIGKARTKDANSNDTDAVDFLQTSSPKMSRQRGGSLRVTSGAPAAGWRSSSLNMGKESNSYRRRVQSKLKKKEDRERERSLPPQCPPLSPLSVLPPASAAAAAAQRVSTYDNAPIVVYNRSYVDGDITGVTGRPPSPASRETRANSSPQIPSVSRGRSESCDTSVSHSSDASLPSTGGSDQEQKPRSASVVRWHSFNRSGGPSSRPAGPTPICPTHVSRMTSGQIQLLKKHALLRITATMERHCPTKSSSWNWEIPKFMRKFRVPDYRDRLVFGVPLTVSARRSGHPIPPTIVQALDYLRKHALDQVGLFRKSGVRSRIQKVRDMCETTSSDTLPFDDHQAYDVADMVKQYFRELPEVLLTNKISEILIAIYQYVPSGLRLEATKCALLLLPDESRLALQTLLCFLSDVAAASYTNQMTPHNLAVCLAPTLFSMTSQRSASASPRRTRKAGLPDLRELNENRAAHECLAALIRQADGVFCLPDELVTGCRFSYLDISQPVSLPALGTEEHPSNWRAYTDACCAALLRETRDRPRGWVSVVPDEPGVDLAFRKVGDGHQLRLWRTSTEVEAPPQEVLHRLLRQRHAYDLRLVKWRVVERLAEHAEVFQYAVAGVHPLPVTDYCVLRAWRSDLARGACAIVETSVEHCDSPVQHGARRGVVLASRYLIEPCGAGKSRVSHFSRADHRGCSPEWYSKVYGHLCGLQMSALRESFRHTILGTAGPESQV